METKVTLETFLATRAGQGAKTLNLVVKADVQGSLEALSESLNKLSTDEVKVNLLHGGVGAISESDIMLASASEAIIIGFNVRPSVKAKELADQEKGGHPLLRHHLQPGERSEGRHVRHAGAG